MIDKAEFIASTLKSTLEGAEAQLKQKEAWLEHPHTGVTADDVAHAKGFLAGIARAEQLAREVVAGTYPPGDFWERAK